MPELKSHLFVCTNMPETKGRCGHLNSEAMRRELKERCKGQEWGKDVRINASGCLGHCERGIAAVLYPQGEWFFDLTNKDEETLFKAVEATAKSK